MRIKKFFRLEEKSIGVEFWNGVTFQPLGENRIDVQNEEYDTTPNFQ